MPEEEGDFFFPLLPFDLNSSAGTGSWTCISPCSAAADCDNIEAQTQAVAVWGLSCRSAAR